MGKKKKIGVVIIIVIIILISIPLFLEYVQIEGGKILEEREEIKKEWLRNFTFEEAESIAIDWNYKDMLRNIDNYSNELIFVEGVVKDTQRDQNNPDKVTMVTLHVNCETEPEVRCYDGEWIFVNVYGITNTWLEDDQLSGFIKIIGLEKTGQTSSTTGEFIADGNYIPIAEEIKLTCSNC